jgi:hypothetical protein
VATMVREALDHDVRPVVTVTVARVQKLMVADRSSTKAF